MAGLVLCSGRTGGTTTYRLELHPGRQFVYRTAFLNYLPEARYFIRDCVHFTVDSSGQIIVNKAVRLLLNEPMTGWYNEECFVRTMLYSSQHEVINKLVNTFRLDDYIEFKTIMFIREKAYNIKPIDKEYVRCFYNMYVKHQIEDMIENFLVTSLDQPHPQDFEYHHVFMQYQTSLPLNGRIMQAIHKYRRAYNTIAEWWEDRYWNPKSPVRKRILMRDLAELNKLSCVY